MIETAGENGERRILQFPGAAVNINCLDTNPVGRYLPNCLYSRHKQWIRQKKIVSNVTLTIVTKSIILDGIFSGSLAISV